MASFARLASALLPLALAAAPALAEDTAGLMMTDWTLVSLDGADFTARATLRLEEAGKLAGQAPCNRYFGQVTGTLPEFRPGAIGSTRMACDDLKLEGDYFTALQAVDRLTHTEAELHLSGGGHVLIFRRPAP